MSTLDGAANRLMAALPHQFAQMHLLQQALTHRSYGAAHNERLEHLGDAVLDCAIADLLYQRYPEAREGDLSRLRANLVCQPMLTEIATALNLGAVLNLGQGERKSGGAQRPSILADALEAVIGAVFLDAGYDAAKRVVRHLFLPLMARLDAGDSQEGVVALHKDAKTRLQEYLQAHKKSLPVYALEALNGQAHDQEFAVSCQIPGWPNKWAGVGKTRRAAEQVAAAAALTSLLAANPKSRAP